MSITYLDTPHVQARLEELQKKYNISCQDMLQIGFYYKALNVLEEDSDAQKGHVDAT